MSVSQFHANYELYPLGEYGYRYVKMPVQSET